MRWNHKQQASGKNRLSGGVDWFGAWMRYVHGAPVPERLPRHPHRLHEATGANLRCAIDHFENRPCAETHDNMMTHLHAHAACVNALMCLAPYLPGVAPKRLKALREKALRSDVKLWQRLSRLPEKHPSFFREGEMRMSGARLTACRSEIEDHELEKVSESADKAEKRLKILCPSQSGRARQHATIKTSDQVSALWDIVSTDPHEFARASMWCVIQKLAAPSDLVMASARCRKNHARRRGFPHPLALYHGDPGFSVDRIRRDMLDALRIAGQVWDKTLGTQLQTCAEKVRHDEDDVRFNDKESRTMEKTWFGMLADISSHTQNPSPSCDSGKNKDTLLVPCRPKSATTLSFHERPWNAYYLLQQEESLCLPWPENVFSASRIRKVVVPDLLRRGGWHCTPSGVMGARETRVWTYRLRRCGRDGKTARADLLVAVDAPRGDDSMASYDGWAEGVRAGFSQKERPVVIAVAQMAWSENNRWLVHPDGLRNLAHELGHVLHFLEMPGHHPEEWTQISRLLQEFPSILWEQLGSRPGVLAFWARKCGASVGADPRYWRRRFRERDDGVLEEYTAQLESGLLDMDIHGSARSPDKALQNIRRQTKRAPLHPNDSSARYLFDFGTTGGMDAAYAIGHALTIDMVSTHPSSRAIERVMRSWLENVAPHTGQPGISSAWETWMGCDISTRIGRAVKNAARQVAKNKA